MSFVRLSLEGNKWVVARLAEHARTHSGCALIEWWSEHRATTVCGQIARPDAAGVWAEHGRRVEWWLELDRGTEPLARVAGKLPGYRQLADAAPSCSGRCCSCCPAPCANATSTPIPA